MKRDDDIHLVYASDARYLKWLAVSIASAFYWAQGKEKIVVHILASGVSAEVWNAWCRELKVGIPEDARILRHDVPLESISRFPKWHGSLAPYYRLMIPEVLADLDWCVYADGDTLFLDDLQKLAEKFDPDFLIMGHKDRTEFNPLLQKWYADRRIPLDEDSYFNSGFLLMNLKAFRSRKVVDQMLAFLCAHNDCLFPDQDALNVACFDHAKLLPKEWGVFICDAFTIGRPSLVHFVYHVPWKMQSLFLHDYYDGYRLWFTYAKRFFNKSWREIVVDPPNEVRYLKMRMLGWALSALRACLPDDCSRIPVIGRYLYRHYATRQVWRSIIRRA